MYVVRPPCPQDCEFWYGELYCRSPYLEAAKQGDLAMLRCLQRLGYPLPPCDDTLQLAVDAECPLEVLQWMVDSGFPVRWREVEAADREGRPAWRCKWSERSVWVHATWRQEMARAPARQRASER